MKNLFRSTALLIIVALFSACAGSDEPNHEMQYSQNGKDSVVYVSVSQQDGSVSNFYMNYLLFRSLYGNGGYGSVNNYYNSHPNEFAKQSTKYSNYGSNVYKSGRINTATEARTSALRAASSPSRSTSKSWFSGSSSTRSSSTPSRSSSSSSSSSYRSYSSPSRSYSSPSRSYSSPSRSYSSPSRSYSSPSRH